MKILNHAQAVQNLLHEYKSKNSSKKVEKIKFITENRKDVYNITSTFEDNGDLLIAGRVEERHSEDSEVMFFKNVDERWVRSDRSPILKLQDPFCTRINGELIFGGVKTYLHTSVEGKIGYRTVFYKGKSVQYLKRFTEGPDYMKDIRILQLQNGKILIFTRPQGNFGGRGAIGYIVVNSLEQLNAESILNAKLIKNQFIESEWGGANELHILKNGLIGVLGHIANYDDRGKKHYYSMTFSFDVSNGEVSPIKIIAIKSDFGKTDFKREDLIDVIFSGGIIRKENGQAELYCGVSDAKAYKIIIEDPFLEYEN